MSYSVDEFLALYTPTPPPSSFLFSSCSSHILSENPTKPATISVPFEPLHAPKRTPLNRRTPPLLDEPVWRRSSPTLATNPVPGVAAALASPVDVAANLSWNYLDPTNIQHGPFSSEQMAHWHSRGFLQDSLLIACVGPTESLVFRTLGAVFPKGSRAFRDQPAALASSRPAD